MNTRLKIICILFGVVYIFVIGDSIVQTILELCSESSIDSIAAPDWVSDFKERLEEGGAPALAGIIIAVILLILVLIFNFLSTLMYIPIQAYKILRSIMKDKIFDTNNITKIRRIGYVTLINFGLVVLVMNPIIKYFYVSLFQVDPDHFYLDAFSNSQYYGSLLFALLILLFAEILKMSQEIKVEQDLTI